LEIQNDNHSNNHHNIYRYGIYDLYTRLMGVINMTPKEAYHRSLNEDKRISELEEIIADDAMYSICYCLNVIQGSWGLAEDTISKDPKWSYMYARDIIKGPWKNGENIISKDPQWSYQYALNIIRGPWKMGEDAISKDSKWSYLYANDVIKGRFKQGEEAIGKDSIYSYWYIFKIIKRPFEKCHSVIFNSEYKDEYLNFLKSINYDLNKISEWML
jgi:hypothetical protein